MNLQEAFDKIYIHAQKKERASLFNGDCMYRTPDGRKCFAGCLIPDALYDPIIEGRSFTCGINHNMFSDSEEEKISIAKTMQIRLALNIDDDLARTIRSLQAIHDNSMIDPREWNEQLQKFADAYNLTVPVI